MKPNETSTHQMSCLEVWGGNEPVDSHVRMAGLDAWVYAVPHENAEAGGDVHFVSSCGSGRIARFCIADVSGHGQAVSEVGRKLRDCMRRFMNHIDQRQFLVEMNNAFTQFSRVGQFATAVVATFYAPTRTLSVCNAGHPPPLLFRARDRQWSVLNVRSDAPDPDLIVNAPLGIIDDVGYLGFDLNLHPGDLLLCHTDSLTEARTRDGAFLETAGLLDLLNNLVDVAPEHLIPKLLSRLAVTGAVPDDDLTVLLCRASGRGSQASFTRRVGGAFTWLAMLASGRNIPWPEWTLKNLGGYFFPPLSKKR